MGGPGSGRRARGLEAGRRVAAYVRLAPAIHLAARAEAARRGWSLTRLVAELLEEQLGLRTAPPDE